MAAQQCNAQSVIGAAHAHSSNSDFSNFTDHSWLCAVANIKKRGDTDRGKGEWHWKQNNPMHAACEVIKAGNQLTEQLKRTLLKSHDSKDAATVTRIHCIAGAQTPFKTA